MKGFKKVLLSSVSKRYCFKAFQKGIVIKLF